MKVNEAPEKLYIVLNELTEDGRTFVLDHRVDYPTCTEYTRTDAFIEKACEFISFNIADYIDVTHHGGIERVVLQERVIEEFRKYMKGE